MNTKPTTGWQCPCCSTIYSPAVMSCACQKPESKQPVDTHDNRREALEGWKKTLRDAQMRNPQSPPIPGLFSLDPTCTRIFRAPAPFQTLGKPGERRFFRTHRRPTPGITDPS